MNSENNAEKYARVIVGPTLDYSSKFWICNLNAL